jgi:hypothetical protein
MLAFQGTLTLVRTLCEDSDDSPRVQNLMEAAKHARANMPVGIMSFLWPAVRGTLRAMRGDIEPGVIGSVGCRTAGEVLGDMLGSAKDALTEGSDDARNVAAVLAAATYEDTIRRRVRESRSLQPRT